MNAKEFGKQIFSKYPASSFTYSLPERQFTIGQETVPLAEKFEHLTIPQEPVSEADAENLMDASPLLIQFDEDLYLMPKLRNWLRASDMVKLRQAKELVIEAMVDAYVVLGGRKSVTRFRGSSHRDFAFGITHEAHPQFQVYGDCACLGVTAAGGIFDHKAWPEGYGQFDLHNVDHPYELVALFAGAGALANVCQTETA